jgi:hypothetical protein
MRRSSAYWSGSLLALCCLLALAVVPASAGTDMMRPYLGWKVEVAGPCQGPRTVHRIGTWFSNGNYEAHTSHFFSAGRQQDQTGTWQTDRWIQNSVKRAAIFSQCRAPKLFHLYSPLTYVHRVRFVNWLCDPNCVPWSSHTTGWNAGTLFDTSDDSWDKRPTLAR